ncbi:hypothetical protein EBU24_03530 [bacterium]|nr:hypothetical protein [bacterium]
MYKTDAGSDPYYFIENLDFRKNLKAAFKCLTKREKDIIFLWVGMYSEEESLNSIANKYHLSSQCILRTKNRGIIRLKRRLKRLMQ